MRPRHRGLAFEGALSRELDDLPSLPARTQAHHFNYFATELLPFDFWRSLCFGKSFYLKSNSVSNVFPHMSISPSGSSWLSSQSVCGSSDQEALEERYSSTAHT